MSNDSCLTLAAPSEALYTEKRSRFLAFAYPVETPEEAMGHVYKLRKEYYDARHVCFAYSTGYDGETFRAVDDGEPSGTAGRPILGQIRSAGLSFTLVVVVRYFGGVQLGAAGLGLAYKTAAAAALERAEKVTRIVCEDVHVRAQYADVDLVMRIARDMGAIISAQDYGAQDEIITLRIRQNEAGNLRSRLEKIHTLEVLSGMPSDG